MTRKGRNKQCQEFTAGNQRRHRPPLPEWARENIILEGGRHTSLDLDGVPVDFCEYQNAPGGDFVKICCAGHERGVRAEYAWFGNKYPGAILARQCFTTLVVNGSPAKCDILTIELPDGTEQNLYFDISAMMDDLHKKANPMLVEHKKYL